MLFRIGKGVRTERKVDAYPNLGPGTHNLPNNGSSFKLSGADKKIQDERYKKQREEFQEKLRHNR